MTDQLKSQFISEFDGALSLGHVEELRVKYLGKTGIITQQMKAISSIPPEERKTYGAGINLLKNFISEEIELKKNQLLKAELEQKLANEFIDVTISPQSLKLGKIHPVTNAINEVKHIFNFFGFEFVTGPEIDDEWHNFDALNILEDHPARQMHDTFYIKNNPHMLLRTHTSNIQIRSMVERKAPLRLFTIGKTYRSDSDSTHSPMFHQLEVIYIDEKVNISNLKFCLEQFLQKFFCLEAAPIRLRPSYFPFTEPSMEVDVQCDRSNKELIIGKGNDWIEILGAGMIDPKVLENCGVDCNKYQGFALGAGIERLAMLKYNINDLRKFYDGDIRWLKHYGF